MKLCSLIVKGGNILLEKKNKFSPIRKIEENLLLDTVEPDDTFQIWSGLAGVHSEKAIDWQDL